MKILCCGSRSYNKIDKIREKLKEFSGDIAVIHGASAGADYLSGVVAKELGFKVEEFPADWNTYGKQAGIVRNYKMLDQKPDLVIAFWDGFSNGTRHTINTAIKSYGIKTEVIN